MPARILAVLLFAASLAWSQPPSPGPGELRQPVQEERGSAEQHAPIEGTPADKALPPIAMGRIEQPRPSISKPKDNRHENKANSQAPYDGWGTVADWRMVYLTTVLALVAAFQLGAFVWQLRYMRASLDAAATSADAARRSADAIAALERPWILISEPPLETSHRDGTTIVRARFKLTNVGRAPAWISRVRLSIVPVPKSDMEGRPYAVEEGHWRGRPMAPKQEIDGDRLFGIREDAYSDLLTQVTVMMFYGVIEYTDPLGKPHDTGFCWIYERRILGPKPADPNSAWNMAGWQRTRGPDSYIRNT